MASKRKRKSKGLSHSEALEYVSGREFTTGFSKVVKRVVG